MDPSTAAATLLDVGWVEVRRVLWDVMPFTLAAGVMLMVIRRIVNAVRAGQAPGV